MWFGVALLGSLFSAASSLLNRQILKNKPDSLVYSLFFSIVCSIFSLPLFIYFFVLPSGVSQWLSIIVLSGIVVAYNYLLFTGYKHLSPSWARTLLQTKYIWIVLFGALFLSEFLSTKALLGLILIVSGGLLTINRSKGKNEVSTKGTWLILSAAFAMAIYSLLTKFVLREISPYALTFLLFFFPMLINFLVIRNAKQRVASLWKILPKKRFALIGILAVTMNVCLLVALSLGNVAQVIVVFECAAVFLIIGEYFFLKEREHLWKKILALLLAAIGAVIVRG
jgi:drug/metabolite transporter (DMT)-like permease